MSRFRALSLPALAVAALLVGCGGDEDGGDTTAPGQAATTTAEQDSGDELRQELERVDREVSQAFGQVFESGIDQLPPNQQVPEAVKEALAAAAEVEREAAEQLSELDPPEDAQEAVEGLAETAREQADTLSEAAEQEDLTARQLQQAFEEQSPERYLNELEELGYLSSSDGGDGEGGGDAESGG